jgi:hypothetical protein
MVVLKAKIIRREKVDIDDWFAANCSSVRCRGEIVGKESFAKR